MKKIIMGIGIVILCMGFWYREQNHSLKGFSKVEKNWIQSLSKDEQDYFLTHENLYPMLKDQNFKKENFKNYLQLYQKNEMLSIFQVLTLVNYNLNKEIDLTPTNLQLLEEEEFNPEHFERYIQYQSENKELSSKQVIQLVEKDIDLISMKYEKSIEDFLQGTYFIKENIERYIQYQKQFQTDIETTIAYVNSNLDYDYYTNTKDTDLTKGYLMIVNKYYALANDYIPNNLVTIESSYGRNLQMEKTAYEAFKKMADAAKKDGLRLYIQSPYRSYQSQSNLYKNYYQQDKELADTYSARPGYSEHQTGLAVDVVNGPGKSLASFENTKEFVWMQEHAHQYGFILRYTEGKEMITGYQYEPWHYRYIGTDAASKIKELGITFDEYYAYYVR